MESSAIGSGDSYVRLSRTTHDPKNLTALQAYIHYTSFKKMLSGCTCPTVYENHGHHLRPDGSFSRHAACTQDTSQIGTDAEEAVVIQISNNFLHGPGVSSTKHSMLGYACGRQM